MAVLLSGAELVLVAQVPMAGNRWTQVHFNMDVSSQFFRVPAGSQRMMTFERVSSGGKIMHRDSHPLVFSSESNRNCKVEFDFDPVTEYPEDGRPFLLILELDTRYFRYLTLMPSQAGYEEILALNSRLPSVGRGLRRNITTLDEVEMQWPGCPLRRAT